MGEGSYHVGPKDGQHAHHVHRTQKVSTSKQASKPPIIFFYARRRMKTGRSLVHMGGIWCTYTPQCLASHCIDAKQHTRYLLQHGIW